MRVTDVVLVTALLPFALNAQIAIVNNASFRAEQPVAPGSWAAAFGTFSNVSTATAQSFPLGTTLNGVSVSIDGVNAPVYYVSSTQIVFVIPAQATTGLKNVQVRTGSATVTGSVRLISSAPGLFIKDSTQQRPPKGAVLNQNGTENTSSNLARRGEVIQIYATGPGAFLQPVQDGATAPRDPLTRTRSTPQVFIGGVAATVQFSGLAPDLVGVWQINAFIPERPFLSGRVPVQVFMDGVDSNEVTIFVAQ
jgi:uncharacterized protein (TIGR03437 family)